MSPAATCRDRLQERMRSIWETERTGKACVRASSALGSRGEDILPPNLRYGCPSPENNPTATSKTCIEDWSNSSRNITTDAGCIQLCVIGPRKDSRTRLREQNTRRFLA